MMVSQIMLVKQCHKPPIYWNGLDYTSYKHGDLGDCKNCRFTHIFMGPNIPLKKISPIFQWKLVFQPLSARVYVNLLEGKCCTFCPIIFPLLSHIIPLQGPLVLAFSKVACSASSGCVCRRTSGGSGRHQTWLAGKYHEISNIQFYIYIVIYIQLYIYIYPKFMDDFPNQRF